MHEFYLSARKLLSSGVVPPVCVQRSFEAAMAGILDEDGWRPTHISRAAVVELAEGWISNVQRAHGVLEGRKDRFDRTIVILTFEEKPFEEWWEFYKKHDTTVLITRAEHFSNLKFTEDELIPVPWDEQKLFINSGFSFKARKKVELKWARQQMLNSNITK